MLTITQLPLLLYFTPCSTCTQTHVTLRAKFYRRSKQEQPISSATIISVYWKINHGTFLYFDYTGKIVRHIRFLFISSFLFHKNPHKCNFILLHFARRSFRFSHRELSVLELTVLVRVLYIEDTWFYRSASAGGTYVPGNTLVYVQLPLSYCPWRTCLLRTVHDVSVCSDQVWRLLVSRSIQGSR